VGREYINSLRDSTIVVNPKLKFIYIDATKCRIMVQCGPRYIAGGFLVHFTGKGVQKAAAAVGIEMPISKIALILVRNTQQRLASSTKVVAKLVCCSECHIMLRDLLTQI
jgi:hypothetical protein